MLASLFSLGALCTIVLAAYGVGRPLVRWLNVGNEGTPATAVWSVGLGFVVVGWLLSLFGLAGILWPPLIGLVTVAASFWGLGELACVYLAFRNPLASTVTPLQEFDRPKLPASPSSAVRRIACTLFVVSAIATLIAALAPPTSPAALSRYLEVPKTFLLGQRIANGSFDIHAFAPQLGGMIYAWALVLDGPVAATLVAWFFGLLLAAATALLAKPLVGRTWAAGAGMLVILSPGIAYQMAAPLDDLMLAAYLTLALAAWWRGAVELQSPRWFIVAGLLLGGALSVKPLAIAMILAVAVVWWIELWRHREHRDEVIAGAAHTLSLAFVFAGVWYVRALWYRQPIMHLETGEITLRQLGPLLAAIVPGLAMVRRLRGLNLIIGAAVCFAIACRVLAPDARVFAPLVPLLAIIGTWVWMELHRLPAWPRRIAQFSGALIALVIVTANVSAVKDRATVACGWVSPGHFLREHEPTFRAAEVANCVLSANACLLSQDSCGVYFDCPVVNAGAYLRRKHATTAQAAAVSVEQLKGDGFTHLLLCDHCDHDEADSPWAATVALQNDEHVLPLTDYQADSGGTTKRYRLYMLR